MSKPKSIDSQRTVPVWTEATPDSNRTFPALRDEGISGNISRQRDYRIKGKLEAGQSETV